MNEITPDQDSSLEQWLDYLLRQHPIEIDMGLTRVTDVARNMSLLTPNKTVITVGGTNGKGTTCRLIESVLTVAGKNVGVYSSPHLLKFNERIRICGKDVTDAALIKAFYAIELNRNDISLTFFEYATLAALYIFSQADLDVILLEVGLGGRLDATNIIDADIGVITSIDLDHQEYLGNTRELVGIEKAGISRADQPFIIGEPDLPSPVLRLLKQKSAIPISVGTAFEYAINNNDWEYSGVDSNGQRHIIDLPMPELPLPNAATAITTILQYSADITDEYIRKGIACASMAGRFEQLSQSPRILLDVAHNPHAAKLLKQRLKQLLHKELHKKVYALCGMLKDKDIGSVLNVMANVIDDWSLVDLEVERGAQAGQLKQALIDEKQVHCFASISDAWQRLKHKITDEDVVIVFGSFYTVSGFKKLIEQG
ncbi:MAG: bifunctional tetrahydrofolate synthase/dihydrofolate synthase [Parashewanella sp.]